MEAPWGGASGEADKDKGPGATERLWACPAVGGAQEESEQKQVTRSRMYFRKMNVLKIRRKDFEKW